MRIEADSLDNTNFDCGAVQVLKSYRNVLYISQKNDVIEITPYQAQQLVIELTKLITTTT